MAGATFGPAMFKHVRKAYTALYRSPKTTLEHVPQLRRKVHVFEGYTTMVVMRCGIPPSYYSPVMKVLQAMGCVQQHQRGTRETPSILFLMKEPTEADFEQAVNIVDVKRFARQVKQAKKDAKKTA